MTMTRAMKEEEVSFLVDSFQNAPLTICADYRGLDVSKMGALRDSLRETGAFGRVVKNTLTRIAVTKAFEGADSEHVENYKNTYTGPSMVVFAGEDPISPAKAIAEFAKENEEFEIKGGWFEGAYCDAEAIIALSKMPSKEELQAKLLNLINAPAVQLLRLINAPATQTVQVIAAQKAELEKAA